MVMCKSVPRFATLLVGAALIAGCSWFGGGEKERDKDPGVSKMYQDAKEDLEAGNFEKAVKGYEALEARYPYGAYAQQAELELADDDSSWEEMVDAASSEVQMVDGRKGSSCPSAVFGEAALADWS